MPSRRFGQTAVATCVRHLTANGPLQLAATWRQIAYGGPARVVLAMGQQLSQALYTDGAGAFRLPPSRRQKMSPDQGHGFEAQPAAADTVILKGSVNQRRASMGPPGDHSRPRRGDLGNATKHCRGLSL